MILLVPIEELRKAGVVARMYSLQDVSLAEFAARRSAPYSRDPTVRMQLKTSADASHDLATDQQSVSVAVRFEVLASGPASPDPLVTVSGVFALDYSRAVKEGEVEPSGVAAFARINGPYNAWPYIREVVAAAFGRMGYPRLTLEPLIVNPKPTEALRPPKKKAPKGS